MNQTDTVCDLFVRPECFPRKVGVSLSGRVKARRYCFNDTRPDLY